MDCAGGQKSALPSQDLIGLASVKTVIVKHDVAVAHTQHYAEHVNKFWF